MYISETSALCTCVLNNQQPTLYKYLCPVRYVLKVQGVTLATEPDISLIILTKMKILQRNLNSSTIFSFKFLKQ
jgi:hypothetical protein